MRKLLFFGLICLFNTVAYAQCSITKNTYISVCEYERLAPLPVTVSYVGESIQWSSSGSGTFDNTNSASIVYTPASTDHNQQGYYLLYMTVTGADCSIKDSIFVSYQYGVQAPPDFSFCVDGISAQMFAYGATNATWRSLGTGTFSNPNLEGTSYTPSAEDKTHPSVTIIREHNTCPLSKDTLVITFLPRPTINVGADQEIASIVSLSATVSNGAGIFWSSLGSGVFNTTSSLNTTYTPSPQDLASGYVRIIGTTTGGQCPQSKDTLVLTTSSPINCDITVNTNILGNRVFFTANSIQSSGSYRWEFGDGSEAYGKSTSHIYSSISNYNVKLYFTMPDSVCFSQLDTTIEITSTTNPFYSISGTIYANGNTPTDHCNVHAFINRNNYYEYVATVSAVNGVFEFSNMGEGQYILYAVPKEYTIYVGWGPTYFGDATNWLDATPIQLSGTNSAGNDIYLVSYFESTATQGSDIIEGNVYFAAASPSLTSSGDALVHARVSLYDNSNNLISVYNTDIFGNYKFSALASGNYYVEVEYPGAFSSYSSEINIDGNPSTASVYNVDLERRPIILSVDDALDNSTTGVSPNPAFDNITLDIPHVTSGTLNIYSSMGTLVKSNLLINEKTIMINDLPSGAYHFSLMMNDKSYSGTFIKVD